MISNQKILCIIIHGSSEHKNRYEQFKTFLNEKNIDVFIEDLATHGGNLNQEKIHNFTYEEMEQSALKIIDDAVNKYPNHKYIIFGHSMGSFIVKDIVYSNKRIFDGVILSGTNNPKKIDMLLSHFVLKLGSKNKVNKFNNFLVFGFLNVKSKLKGNGNSWLSTDLQNQKNFINDEKCGNSFTNNSLIAMLKFIKNAQDKQILSNFKNKNIPQLIIYGKKDPVTNFGWDIKRMVKNQKKYNIKNQKIISYLNSKHEILFDVEYKKVEEDIIKFLNGF